MGYKPKTIGIDARMYGYAQTGIGNYIRHLLEYIFKLDDKNNYVIFLMPEEYDNFHLPNNRIKKVRVSSKWYGWKEQFLFPLELYKAKLDLMHFTHFNSPVLYLKKSVITIHDITPYFFPGHKMKSLFRKIGFRLVFYSSVKKASKVIAVSKSTKNDIASRFKINRKKIDVIYEGVDSQFAVVDNDEKLNNLRKKHNITKQFIFYTGVWRNHKNLVGLINAFNILKNKYNLNYQLVLGGKEDPYYPEVRQAWEKFRLESDIIRVGFIDQEELPLFYNAAEVFVIPSFYEGFGLIGLEAMATGTPVISSNKTSLPEVLGDASIYFDPKNYEDMAQKIKLVSIDKRLYNKLREKGFAQIGKYSWEKMGRNTIRMYDDILK